MPNVSVPVTRADVVKRARSMVGKGVYKLGAGGRIPKNQTPFDSQGRADCTGFVSWCLGVDRYQPDKINGDEDWIETSAVVRDAQGPAESFVRVSVRQPGDVIVYGDKNGKQGHIGIVSEVDSRGRVTRVVHCASSHKPGAVKETGPDVFLRNGAIVVKFRGLVVERDHDCAGLK